METPFPPDSAAMLGGAGPSSIVSAASLGTAFDHRQVAHRVNFDANGRLGLEIQVHDAKLNVKWGGSCRKPGNSRSSSQFNLLSNPPSLSAPTSNPSVTQKTPLAHLTPIRNIAPTCTLDTMLLDFLCNRQQEVAQGIPKLNLTGRPCLSISSLLNAEKSVRSHSVSELFADIQQTFLNMISLPEQVAILYLMFLLLRWQIYPTPENYDRLPDWLAPRPCQLLTLHPAWMDYLPWPWMRERLVKSFHDFRFENWFVPFTQTLSINWPYEATDCLLSVNDSDDLLINPVFERHMRNIGNWSLGPCFS